MGRTLARVALCAVWVAVAGAQSAPVAGNPYPPLPSKAADYWGEYIKVTRDRIDGELAAQTGFLALDFTRDSAADRRAVMSGEIPVTAVKMRWKNGTEVTVPDHWVHHWRGAVLLQGVRLDAVFARLERDIPGIGRPGVVKASILTGRDTPQLHTYIQVQRQGSFALVPYNFVYNTEHDVLFTRLSPTRGKSSTTATKIAELYHPGSPEEREFKPNEENRLLLRWNSYWRYEETGAGVIAECESVTLSRDPGSIASMMGAHRVASGAAQDAMMQALVNLKSFFRTPPAPSPAR